MSTPLKSWREQGQKTAEYAAAAAGVSLPTWSRWETGKRRIPAERVPQVEAITGIPRQQLRPDIFGEAQ